jgi:hypothetical protein
MLCARCHSDHPEVKAAIESHRRKQDERMVLWRRRTEALVADERITQRDRARWRRVVNRRQRRLALLARARHKRDRGRAEIDPRVAAAVAAAAAAKAAAKEERRLAAAARRAQSKLPPDTSAGRPTWLRRASVPASALECGRVEARLACDIPPDDPWASWDYLDLETV